MMERLPGFALAPFTAMFVSVATWGWSAQQGQPTTPTASRPQILAEAYRIAMERGDIVDARRILAEKIEQSIKEGKPGWDIQVDQRFLEWLDVVLPLAPALQTRVAEAYRLRQLGQREVVSGAMQSAKAKLEQAARIHAEAMGTSDPEYGLTLFWLANAYRYEGNSVKAKESYHKMAAIFKAWGDHPFYATALEGLGQQFAQDWEFAPAEVAFRESLRIIEANVTRNGAGCATSHYGLALVYWGRGNHEHALECVDRAITLVESRGESDLADFLSTFLFQKGRLLEATGDFAQAEKVHRRALEIREKRGVNLAARVESHKRYANVLRQLGRDDESAKFDEKAKALQDKLPSAKPKEAGGIGMLEKDAFTVAYHAELDEDNLAGARTLLAKKLAAAKTDGSTRSEIVEVESELEWLERVLLLEATPRARVGEARRLARRGAFSIYHGWASLAEEQLRKAERMYSDAMGRDDSAYAEILNWLIEIDRGRQDYKSMKAHSARLLDICKKWGPPHPKYSLALTSQGHALVGLGEFKRAEAVLEEASGALQGSVGPADWRCAPPQFGLALAYRGQGDMGRALAAIDRAIWLVEPALKEPMPAEMYSVYLYVKGTMFAEQGNLAEAEKWQRLALEHREKQATNANRLAQSHASYAKVLRRLGRNAEALEHETKAQAIRSDPMLCEQPAGQRR